MKASKEEMEMFLEGRVWKTIEEELDNRIESCRDLLEEEEDNDMVARTQAGLKMLRLFKELPHVILSELEVEDVNKGENDGRDRS